MHHVSPCWSVKLFMNDPLDPVNCTVGDDGHDGSAACSEHKVQPHPDP